MRILFVSNYFTPEVNAPARRLHEHAVAWVESGHRVDVLTAAPHFPEGIVYGGYKNSFSEEEIDGIQVTRVPTFVSENTGTIKRTLSYISFMISSIIFSFKFERPDIVIATSPQFFAALGGYFVAKVKRVPFVLEIRDLWPESIVAVGAMKRNIVIQFFERIEQFLYRNADHIVTVTNSFKKFIESRGIEENKISVVKNGVMLTEWEKPLDEGKLNALIERYNLRGKFVVAFIGTIGMAHRASILYEAAAQCTDKDIVFIVVGTGAERESLEDREKAVSLGNFRLLPKVSKDNVHYLLSIADVSVVHLIESPIFTKVIPSKMFEAMATRTPIVLGVKGEARELLEEANAGISFQPENVSEFLSAIGNLKNQPELYQKMAENGREYVKTHHNRCFLAKEYLNVLESVILAQ